MHALASSVLCQYEIQSSDHPFGSDPFQHESFMFAAETRLNVDARERDGTLASQETDEFVVGRAVDRWCRDADFQRVTVDAHTLCDTRVRLNVDDQEGSIFSILHERKIHPR